MQHTCNAKWQMHFKFFCSTRKQLWNSSLKVAVYARASCDMKRTADIWLDTAIAWGAWTQQQERTNSTTSAPAASEICKAQSWGCIVCESTRSV